MKAFLRYTHLSYASLTLLAMLSFSISNTFAQVPQTLWTQTFGGGELDASRSAQQTADGGFIIVGTTYSFGSGDGDIWLVRTDENGIEQWSKTFGGGLLDNGNEVRQTADGGFVIVGETRSFGEGEGDFWVIRTDENGDELWTQTFGDTQHEIGLSIQETPDGGFIMTGITHSFGAGNGDMWLVRTDSTGNTLWSQTFGSSETDFGNSVQITSDGGYVLVGNSESEEGDLDVMMVRTDADGGEEWTVTFGDLFDASDGDNAQEVQQTEDGGFVIFGDYFTETKGNSEMRLIRTDGAGNLMWMQTYGDPFMGDEFGFGVRETPDGGFILTGQTSALGAGFVDIWILRTDKNGDAEWTQTYGGAGFDSSTGIAMTADGGYVIAGNTTSIGAGSTDMWLIRLDTEFPLPTHSENSHTLSQELTISPNYPNPFTQSTTIQYALSKTTSINVEIYSVLGRKVKTLVEAMQSPGNYNVQWDGKDDDGASLASGIYLYKIHAGNSTHVHKMLLVR